MATIKQKRALEAIVENRGNISKSMREVGYSEKTAKNPQNLTKSKGFMELIEQTLPDSLLAKRHLEGLDATSLYGKDAHEHPDYATRFRYLEGAYRLKGKLEQGSNQGSKTLVLVVSGETASRYVKAEVLDDGSTKPSKDKV